MAIGRISGPLLKANLVRDGVDLAFETDLLYIDVNNSRVGVKTASPLYDLDVNGTLRTNNLLVDTQADIGEFTFVNNAITSSNNVINFIPAGGEATVYHSRVQIHDIEIINNSISTNVSNSNLELKPNGTGIVDVYSNTTINGNLTVTGDVNVSGNINIGGNIVIGDELTDTITINASIQSSLIPQFGNTFDLGSITYPWRNIYAQNVFAGNLNLSSLIIGNLIFENNSITTSSGLDLVLTGNSTGGVQLGNFKFANNSITNISNNAISQLVPTGTGYYKFEGSNGVVLPRGTNAQRPTAYAVLGMVRYNTEERAIEVWDGFDWASPAGPAGAITVLQAEDISIAYAIALG